MESLVSLGWCIRRGSHGEGDGDADYLPPLVPFRLLLTGWESDDDDDGGDDDDDSCTGRVGAWCAKAATMPWSLQTFGRP